MSFHTEFIEVMRLLSEAFQNEKQGQGEGLDEMAATDAFVDMNPPPFVDPFLFGSVDEDLTQTALKANNWSLTSSSTGSNTPCLFLPLDDSGTSSLEKSAATVELVNSLQIYFEGIFSLVDDIDETLFDMLERYPSLSKPQLSVVNRLGRLLGRLLRGTDSDERSGRLLSSLDFLLDENEHTRRPFWFPYLFYSKKLKSKLITGESPSPPASPSHSLPTLSSSGVLQLSMNLSSEYNGGDSRSLSSKSELELLRAQRSRCLGCGEHLYTLGLAPGLFGSFLGSLGGLAEKQKNFAPCRYSGGLFCKRWCHRDDRRVIPYRLLLFWDSQPHRVSRQAAAFIDQVQSLPVLNLPLLNPLLLEGVPTLRTICRMRVQIAFLIEKIYEKKVKGKVGPSSGAASKLHAAISNTLGGSRGHLCIAKELFSLHDLTLIQEGQLIQTMERTLAALFALLDCEN